MINASGGLIAHHKSLWSLLLYQDGTFPPQIKVRSNRVIRLDDGKGAMTAIRQVDSSKPKKGLGCLQAIDANQEEEFETRLTKCRKLASSVSRARLNLHEVHHLMHPRIMPATIYPMTVTTFTAKQCKQLNTAIDAVMLNKYRMNRHTPKAVVYSPLHLGSLNYPSYLIKQDQRSLQQ